MQEQNYIRWRKIKAWGNRLAFYLCRIFPIKRHRICIATFEGKGGFGCNPKYIVRELHRRHPDYEFIWLVKDRDKRFPDYVKKAPYTVWGRAYWMSTAKVWIDNYRTHYGTAKRKGQYYLNTNHYTEGIKCTGLLRGEGFSRMAYLVSKADSDQMDALVTDSRWCDAVMPDSMLLTGMMLKTGAPRCDVLYGDRSAARQRIRERQGLPQDAHIVMYAPTFREGAKNGKRSVYSEAWTLDFVRLLDTLEAKFGGKWYLCLRVHPQLAPTFHQYENEALAGRVFDESQADDMYEVLAGMDFYITDYSSAIFEAGFAGIPAFIYADDIAQYAHDRGALMWNLATDPHERVRNNKAVTPQFDLTLPFPVASDNEELLERLQQFDWNVYHQTMEKFAKDIGLVFDGKASARVAENIGCWMEDR